MKKNLPIPELEGILAEKAKRRLKEFIKQAWNVIEPATPFIESWHIDAIADHLEAVFEGQILNLLINVSPRRSKSTIVAKCWPAWGWIKQPAFDWLFASFSAARAISDSVECRRIIESPWYKRNWGDKFYLTSDQNQKSRFENSATGKRLALGLLGGGTGEGADAIICVPRWTRIATRFGYSPIDHIDVGDEVLSFNHETSIAEYGKVLKVHKRFYIGPLISIDTGEGSKLRCTTEHPIYVINRGYINANDLKQGDTILFRDLSLNISEREDVCRSYQEFLSTHDSSSQGCFQDAATERSLSGDQEIRVDEHQDQAVDDLWDTGDGCVHGAKDYSEIKNDKAGWVQSINGRRAVSQWNQRDGMECGNEGCAFSEAESDVGEPGISSKAIIQNNVSGSQKKIYGNTEVQAAKTENNQGEKTRRSIAIKDDRGAGAYCSEAERGNGKSGCSRSIVRNSDKTMGRSEVATMEKGYDPACYDERNACKNFSVSFGSQPQIMARPGISQAGHGWSPPIKTATIKSISRMICALSVFNLEVEGNNNYFAEGILTHNCDDPHDIVDAYNPKKLTTDINAWDQVFSQRANNPKLSRKVVVMQRISGRDLAAHLIKQGGYELLILPTEYDPRRSTVTSIGWKDPRKIYGELLNSERFGPKEIIAAKRTLAAKGYAAQHQQSPSEDEGAIFKRPHWRFYRERPEELVKSADMVIISVDCAFKDEQSSSLVAVHTWMKKGPNKYLLDRDSTHKDFVATVRALSRMANIWPDAIAKVIEDKANGPAVINICQNSIAGLLAYQPEGSKVSRANAMQPEHEAGNIWLPHPDICPWTDEFIEICASFPEGEFDDDIDAMTQAWDWFRTHSNLNIDEMVSNNADIPNRMSLPVLW